MKKLISLILTTLLRIACLAVPALAENAENEPLVGGWTINAENVAEIRRQMEAAALAAGRDPKDILLCAATKMNDADAVRQAIAAGVDCCGENRVQELVQKSALHAYDGKPVHFIGHLQTNKVRQVVGKVELIQSVDRIELLACIEKEAARQDLI